MMLRLLISTCLPLIVASSLPIYRDTVQKVEAADSQSDHGSCNGSSHSNEPDGSGEDEREAPCRLENLPSPPNSKAGACRSELMPRRTFAGASLDAVAHHRDQIVGSDRIMAAPTRCSRSDLGRERLIGAIQRHAPPVVE